MVCEHVGFAVDASLLIEVWLDDLLLVGNFVDI